MWCDVDMHLHRTLQEIDEVLCHSLYVVDVRVLEYGRVGGLLHCLGGESLSEEIVLDIGHLAEDRQVRRALYFKSWTRDRDKDSTTRTRMADVIRECRQDKVIFITSKYHFLHSFQSPPVCPRLPEQLLR